MDKKSVPMPKEVKLELVFAITQECKEKIFDRIDNLFDIGDEKAQAMSTIALNLYCQINASLFKRKHLKERFEEMKDELDLWLTGFENE